MSVFFEMLTWQFIYLPQYQLPKIFRTQHLYIAIPTPNHMTLCDNGKAVSTHFWKLQSR